jgi:hypothetical protein
MIDHLTTRSYFKSGIYEVEDGQLVPTLQEIVRSRKISNGLTAAINYIDSLSEKDYKQLISKWPENDGKKFENKIGKRLLQIRYLLRLADSSLSRQKDTGQQQTDEPEINVIDQLARTELGKHWSETAYLRWLQSDNSIGHRSLRIPVALYREEIVDGEDKPEGFLAWLQLELWEGLTGAFQHPQDFYTDVFADFHGAMRNAWHSAQELRDYGNDAAKPPLAGCWRLLDTHDPPRPLKLIKGKSAGGAAALGWHHLYSGTRPDAEIIVLAACKPNGELQGVDGIREKMQAIVNAQRFDTVVVATEQNKREALEALAKLDGGRSIRVDFPENLVEKA